MNVIVVPGFGDSSRHWKHHVDTALEVDSTAVDYPGVWDSRDPGATPLDDMVTTICERAGRETLLVAHSLGCRVALAAARRTGVKGVVLLAPGLGPISFMGADLLRTWFRTGTRPTERPHPDTGDMLVVDIDASYARNILTMHPVKAAWVPTLAVLVDADPQQNSTSHVLLPASSIVEVHGPHRWWENANTTLEVTEHIRQFVRNLR